MNGNTVAELDAQIDALVCAVAAHNRVIQDAEQAAIADPTHTDEWATIIAVHHDIVNEHVTEIRLLRAEIALLVPGQRRPEG